MSKQYIRPSATKSCQFCNGFAQHSPLQELSRYKVAIYFCHLCQAEYLYSGNDELLSVSLYTTINNRMYRWSLSSDFARLWWVKKPGITGVKKNEGLVCLLTLEENIPSLLPSNINEKVKNWLLFL